MQALHCSRPRGRSARKEKLQGVTDDQSRLLGGTSTGWGLNRARIGLSSALSPADPRTKGQQGDGAKNAIPTQQYFYALAVLACVCAANGGGFMCEAANGGEGIRELHLSCMSQEQARRVRAQSELWETNDVCSEGSGVAGLWCGVVRCGAVTLLR